MQSHQDVEVEEEEGTSFVQPSNVENKFYLWMKTRQKIRKKSQQTFTPEPSKKMWKFFWNFFFKKTYHEGV